MEGDDIILRVSNLSYSYGRNKVLDNISFSLNKGDHLNIIGTNGSGKSTLLKCLYGFLNYRGSIKIDDTEVSEMKNEVLSSKITVLHQEINTYFNYKVVDVIKFGRYVHDKWKLSLKNKDELLWRLGISHLENKYMDELSGGERQRVFIARVLAQDTDIILFDEPSNNLDMKYQIYMIENISKWFEGKILISIFHDLNLVNNLDCNIMMLKDSKVYRYGKIDEVFNKFNLQDLYEMDVEKFMLDSFKKWKRRSRYIT